LQRLGIEPGRNTVSLLRKEDWARLACASRKVTARYCKQRKLKRFEKMKRKKEVSYLPGAFEIAKVPETVGRKLGVKAAKKTTKKSRKRTFHVASLNEPGTERNDCGPNITFIDEKDIQIIKNS